jgi:hypothetical protein
MIVSDKVNFCALPVNRVKITKLDKKSSAFLPHDAMFVLLDGNSKLDKKAVSEAIKIWGNAPFKNVIDTATQWMNIKNPNNIKIYMLTEQLSNLKRLDSRQILGIADVRTESGSKESVLNFLQVRPDAQNVNSKSPKYNGVGTVMVKRLQKIYDKIESDIVPDENVINFYTNLGFVKDGTGEYGYSWQKCWIIQFVNNIKRIAALF